MMLDVKKLIWRSTSYISSRLYTILVSTMSNKILNFLICAILIAISLNAVALADKCNVQLEVPFSLNNCKVVYVKDKVGSNILEISFKSVTRDPKTSLTCWEYKVKLKKDMASFKHCNTGKLGGTREFKIGDKLYLADMDVPVCDSSSEKQLTMAIWFGGTATHPEYRRQLYSKRVENCKITP